MFVNQVNHPLPGIISKKYVSKIPPGQKAQEANSCDPPPILPRVNQLQHVTKNGKETRTHMSHINYSLRASAL